MIDQLTKQGHGIRQLCELYDVSASGYYQWLEHEPGRRQREDAILGVKIEEIYRESRCNYGSPRILVQLRRDGWKIGKKRVVRLMKERDIKVVQKPSYRPRTTDSKHSLPVSENLLQDLGHVENINQVWVSDITYIPTREGWMYLSAFMDLKSRKIKGWRMRSNMKTDLVLDAYMQAVFTHRPPEGLIVHSDRGSQYASGSFREALKRTGAISSMSGKGYCYDNAAMESFWATLKKDLKITKPFKTKEDAKETIFDYIEVYYNRRRIHSSINDLSPVDFEAQVC